MSFLPTTHQIKMLKSWHSAWKDESGGQLKKAHKFIFGETEQEISLTEYILRNFSHTRKEDHYFLTGQEWWDACQAAYDELVLGINQRGAEEEAEKWLKILNKSPNGIPL